MIGWLMDSEFGYCYTFVNLANIFSLLLVKLVDGDMVLVEAWTCILYFQSSCPYTHTLALVQTHNLAKRQCQYSR